MNNYFLQEGGTTVGPFTLDQLKEKKILKSTYVWNRRFEGWQLAGYIEDLKNICYIAPPPFEPALAPVITTTTQKQIHLLPASTYVKKEHKKRTFVLTAPKLLSFMFSSLLSAVMVATCMFLYNKLHNNEQTPSGTPLEQTIVARLNGKVPLKATLRSSKPPKQQRL